MKSTLLGVVAGLGLSLWPVSLSAASGNAPDRAADPAASTEASATLIVLDASGSMKERIKGEPKIDIAKRAVRELIASVPDGARLGLVVYSHRKSSDCDDIELLIPPGLLDRAAFVAAVDKIKPRGLTPLSGALEFAARVLEYDRKPGNVILVSDGVETCGKDPCATAARLKKAGVDFVVHAVAFDLSAKEAKSIACMATATGGRFLQARDAASLKDALSVVVAEAIVVPPPPKPQAPLPAATPAAPPKVTPPPPPAPKPVTLKVPPTVDVGAAFPVGWTGPDEPGDFITIVAKGTADDEDGNLAYTRRGSPLELTAPVEPGEAEVRYVSGRTHAVLARAALKVLGVEVTLAGPAEAVAGSEVAITWKGPANDGDYLVIMPQGAVEGDEASIVGADKGSPARGTAPMKAGPAEIRYMSGQRGHILGRRPIEIMPAKITLTAPDEAVAGSAVGVVWAGPNNKDDYITIVAQAAPEGSSGSIAYTVGGSPLEVTAPAEPAACEIRYVSGQGQLVLARRALKTIAGEATLSAPAEVFASATVEVAWTGPNNENDYITIVAKSAAADAYEGVAYTAGGSPLQVAAPVEPGACEVRYVSGQNGRVVARRGITLAEPRVTLRAPARAPLGEPVSVVWTGPNGENDYVTIVPGGSPDDASVARAWTMIGSPAQVDPPAEAGACEVRYVSGRTGRVLGRLAIEITTAGTPASP